MRICHHTRLGFKRETKGVSLGITLGVGQIILGFFLDRLYQIESHGHKKIFENWVELGVNSCNPIEIYSISYSCIGSV
jgi:hypothetical protein